jgi:hypothetical protein
MERDASVLSFSLIVKGHHIRSIDVSNVEVTDGCCSGAGCSFRTSRRVRCLHVRAVLASDAPVARDDAEEVRLQYPPHNP